MTTATPVFPGSFDPFTLGHLDIARRAQALFGSLVVLVAVNDQKKPFLSLAERIEAIQDATQGIPNLTVDSWGGLTVDYLRKHNLKVMVRGVRNSADLEFEQAVAWNNQKLMPECETIFLSAKPEHLSISSSIVRELVRHDANLSNFVP
jgi:pantetheine-phosphate adenylyltransferase